MESNTDLYQIRERIQNNRKNLSCSSEKVADVLLRMENFKIDMESFRHEIDLLRAKIDDFKNCFVTNDKLVEQINDYSKNTVEPIMNEFLQDLEALTIDTKALKQQSVFPIRQVQDVDDDIVSVNGDKKRSVPAIKPMKLNKRF